MVGPCLLKDIIEGKIEEGIKVLQIQGRRRKQLLDVLKETMGDCKLKEEALDPTLRRTCVGGGYGPVVRQTAKWMDG